jgi:glycosyltransferase involved in cell wall biosynthesis
VSHVHGLRPLEATSITGLEPMARSLPLVGTVVGGIPVLVNDQGTGLLVAPGNHQALAAAIRQLLVNRSLREQFGRAGRQRVIDHFSWTAMTLRTAKIYELH